MKIEKVASSAAADSLCNGSLLILARLYFFFKTHTHTEWEIFFQTGMLMFSIEKELLVRYGLLFVEGSSVVRLLPSTAYWWYAPFIVGWMTTSSAIWIRKIHLSCRGDVWFCRFVHICKVLRTIYHYQPIVQWTLTYSNTFFCLKNQSFFLQLVLLKCITYIVLAHIFSLLPAELTIKHVNHELTSSCYLHKWVTICSEYTYKLPYVPSNRRQTDHYSLNKVDYAAICVP